MKTIVKKRIPKKIIILSVIALLLVASALFYTFAINGGLFKTKTTDKTTEKTNTVNYGSATKEQQEAGSKLKTGSSDTPPEPTVIPGSTKKNVQITNSVTQLESVLHIGTQIGIVENTGTCKLTLSSPEKTTVVKTSGIQAMASTSTCQGFDIPLSELSAGTWKILLEYNSDAYTGSATADKVIE